MKTIKIKFLAQLMLKLKLPLIRYVGYKLRKRCIKIFSFIYQLIVTLDDLSKGYDYLILIGDFNVELQEINVCQISRMSVILKILSENMFAKSKNSSCMGLIPTNSSHSIQNTCSFETSPSDFQIKIMCYAKTVNGLVMVFFEPNFNMKYQNLIYIT